MTTKKSTTRRTRKPAAAATKPAEEQVVAPTEDSAAEATEETVTAPTTENASAAETAEESTASESDQAAPDTASAQEQSESEAEREEVAVEELPTLVKTAIRTTKEFIDSMESKAAANEGTFAHHQTMMMRVLKQIIDHKDGIVFTQALEAIRDLIREHQGVGQAFHMANRFKGIANMQGSASERKFYEAVMAMLADLCSDNQDVRGMAKKRSLTEVFTHAKLDTSRRDRFGAFVKKYF